MKIFFTASYKHKNTYQKYYDLVLKTIQSQKVELRSPELDPSFSSPTSDNHYQSIKQSIAWADAVIFDISHAGFQLGHEATLAIQNKKHVLCLSIHEDYSKRINNRYFHGSKYSELNVNDIITDFINSLKHHQFDQRFNFFLSAKQLNTLGLNATKHNQSKSDYLRSLIDKI